MSKYQDPIKFIKTEFLSCWTNCTNAHNIILNNESKTEVAVTYTLIAMSHLSCIKSVYTCNLNELENSMVEEVIHQLEVFCDELLTSFCTDHSPQWVDIEFNRLEELITNSGLLEF